jgi:TonB-linked SusC/RagA family outer membrane protein
MEKKLRLIRRCQKNVHLRKIWMTMKLTTALFFLAITQIVASEVYSQTTRMTLQLKDATVREVLNRIEDKSEFFFLYNSKLVDVDRKVSVDFNDEKINEILNSLFRATDVAYTVVDRQIVLTNKADQNSLALLSSQQNGKKVAGKVTDATGASLPGVSVVVKGTTTGIITDLDGNFTLPNVKPESVLQFSFIGMKTQEIKVGNSNSFKITLLEETIGIEEVVAVGYGIQKKVILTGAVSAIKGQDIVTTKNENAQNLLTGKISGVRVTQKTSEPGAFNNNFDIRAMGSPLIIIDGIPRTNEDFQRMDANDIDNISVLKDASAAIYGVRAANGVVLVNTKKGSKNKVELNYSGSFIWQIPSGLPETVDAIGYMTLRNERSMHNLNGGSPIFNDQQFDDYKTGKLKSTNWYPLVFSKSAPQTIHNLNVTGGNDKTTYYVGLGYQYQDGFFKSSDLNYTKYNVRSNISTKITDRLTFDLNLNLVMDEQDRPYQDSWWIIRGFWRQGPQIPAYANNDPTKPYHGLIEGDNPISFMDKDIVGYKKYNKKWLQSSASLKYEVPGVKGLFVKGLFSYDYSVSSANVFQKQYDQYRYDEASATYTTFSRQSPNRITREAYFTTQTLSQVSLNYDATFNKHKIGALVLGEAQKRSSDNFSARRDLGLQMPYLFAGIAEGQLATMNSGSGALYQNSNLALAGRFNYAFSDKYLAEFLFRYDGSSKFAPGSQWGFFPAASLGWRVSEEKFFKNIAGLSIINQFKVRASYGKTGDDGASSYQWTSGYNYPTGTDARNFTGGYVFNGSFNASADNKGIPNPFITWYTAKTFDVGTDIEMWNGLLGVTADYFSRNREGLLAQRNGGIPTVVGAGLPQENLNGDRTYGFDLELSHRNHIGGFEYNVKGLFSLARVKRLYVESSTMGSSWSNWKNNQNDRFDNRNDPNGGVPMGYEGAGQYQSWNEIWSSPTYIGRGTVPGDYKYQDWNGDGEINGNDVHPTGFNQYPWMNYSFIFDAKYKGFDMNFLLQGSAMSNLTYGEQLREPMWGSGESGAMVQFMDRWHPADPKADPYDPATQWVSGHYAYTGTLPDAGSTFNVVNSAYLRLKSVELGYTIPDQVIKRSGLKNLRVFVNAYNMFTITQVKYVDPEHPNDTYGYLYPLNKTVSVGLNVKF